MSKNKILLVGILVAVVGILFYSLHTELPYSEQIIAERENYQKTILNLNDSPVEVKSFDHFNYFDVDENWVVEAEAMPNQANETFNLMMTDSTTEAIPNWGTATFSKNGVNCVVKLFDEDDHFLLPFLDETNGISTYGGGRFINIDKSALSGNKMKIDFNKAHNFYCAYSESFICPIPPKENKLSLKVEAGEKKYK